MCSDGLNGEISDFTIEQIVCVNKEHISSIPQKLIDAANSAGGKDNVTVAVLCAVNSTPEHTHSGVFFDIHLKETVTLNDKISEQNLFEQKRILSKYKRHLKNEIPLCYKENNTVFKYVVLTSVIFFLVFSALLFSFSFFKKRDAKNELIVLSDNIRTTKISLDVRTLTPDMIERLNSAQEELKPAILKEALREKEKNTIPVPNAKVLLSGKKISNKFIGLSNFYPIKIKLPVGEYMLELSHPGYKIMDSIGNFIDVLDMSIEVDEEINVKTVIMMPENS
jgi:hypothetical protein